MGTMLTKRRLLAAKIETTKGTAIAITASTDGAMNIYNVKLNAPNDKTEREQQGTFNRLKGVVGKRMATISFDVDIVGKGASSATPLEASTFLPCCAFANSSGTFTRTADVTAQSTCTIILYKDGKKHSLVGCMGTFKDVLTDGERGVRSYTFTGKYPITSNPADASLPSLPTFPTTIPPRGLATFTIAGVSALPRTATVTFDAGNTVKLLEDITDETGYAYCVVSDAKATIAITPEQDTIANAAWETLMATSGEVGGVTCVAGGTSLNIITYTAASGVEVTGVDEDEREGVLCNSVTLSANSGFVIAYS
jgi:hypothetical protein